MYFNRMAKYYDRQSSGRYSVKGDVTEWVKVPFKSAATATAHYPRLQIEVATSPDRFPFSRSRFLFRNDTTLFIKSHIYSANTIGSIKN